ncbi:MAG: PAS domain-containing protein, partial [Acidobacteriota bacterium]
MPPVPRIHGLRAIISRMGESIRKETDAKNLQCLTGLLDDLGMLEAGLDRYLGLFERAVQGIFIVTAEGVPVDCNQAFASMIGYDSPEELLESVGNVGEYHFADPDQRAKNVALVKERGELVNREVVLRHRDGSPIWTLVNMRLTRTGLIEGICIDITPQKLAERKLMESEEKHRRIIETAGEGFYLTDRNLAIVSVNKAMCRMT